MALTIKRAVKYDAKLRMSISGPSGSGKTFTALTLATALAGERGVLVVDTERGSASKYADLFTFDVVELDTFSPATYVEAIKLAEESGHGVLVIDSLSHAWNGTGGLLEIVDAIARRKYQNNTFAAWKDATPLQNQLIDAITRSSLHIIVTMRSKQEHVQEKDERTGRTVVKKLGMAPIQRDGMEYEFDIAADMDIDNTMIIQKSRCSALAGQIIPRPGASVADALRVWLQGAPAPAPQSRQVEQQPAPQMSQEQQTTTKHRQFTPISATPIVTDGPASEQQINSLHKLCEHLGSNMPDTSDLTTSAARKLIQDLTAQYKERQQSQRQVTQQTQTAQQSPLLVMINKAKARVEALDMIWQDVKRDALKKQVEDSVLTVAQVATINGVIKQYEDNKAARPAAKAS